MDLGPPRDVLINRQSLHRCHIPPDNLPAPSRHREAGYSLPMLTYAIGDIHGRHDLLGLLLDRIRQHSGRDPHRLVFVGDYIDRGPDSAAVVETVIGLQTASPDQVVCLMGNHESMLLAAVDDSMARYGWMHNGGASTLESYGASAPSRIPPHVLKWMRGLPTSFEDELRYYVHAGLRPGIRLDEQLEEDKLWIREPFLDVDYDFGKHVVHGHTPVLADGPDTHPFRTNLDTGAVFKGVLTAGIFNDRQGPPIGFLSASLPS
jgi:serine/threonine protein phosphatase 1